MKAERDNVKALIRQPGVHVFRSYNYSLDRFKSVLSGLLELEPWRNHVVINDQGEQDRGHKMMKLFKQLQKMPPFAVVRVDFLDYYINDSDDLEPLLWLVHQIACERNFVVVMISRNDEHEDFLRYEPYPLHPNKVVFRW